MGQKELCGGWGRSTAGILRDVHRVMHFLCLAHTRTNVPCSASRICMLTSGKGLRCVDQGVALRPPWRPTSPREGSTSPCWRGKKTKKSQPPEHIWLPAGTLQSPGLFMHSNKHQKESALYRFCILFSLYPRFIRTFLDWSLKKKKIRVLLSGQTVNTLPIFMEGKGHNKDSQMSPRLINILCWRAPISSEISERRVIAKITFI